MNITPYLKNRLRNLQEKLKHANTPWYLISHSANLKYLTGVDTISPFHREIFALISPNTASFFHSPLVSPPKYLGELGQIQALGRGASLSNLIQAKVDTTTLTADFNDLKMGEVVTIEKNTGLKLTPSESWLEIARVTKDAYELEQVKTSCRMASEVWGEIKPLIRVGITERQVAGMINNAIEERGGSVGEEFPPIVAFGSNSSIPHHQTSQKALKNNEVVLVDFGCKVAGYWSDMTRTMWVGNRVDNDFSRLETTVKTAYARAFDSINTTKNGAEADKVVSQYLASVGFADKMPHTTGHGLGLEVHESPSISRYAPPDIVSQNIIFTIEPGVYIPGKWGYRYENTLEMTAKGVRELT